MPGYEYKILPAPSKGRKGPGIRGGEARFAYALETMINEMAATGWHYQRSDMLPHEERQGIRSTQTTYRSVLVFRRDVDAQETIAEPRAEEIAPPVEEHVAEYSEPETESNAEPDDFEPWEHENETPPERFT